MAAQRKYPDELRERAVKMVFEIRELDGKGHGEISRVARQLDVQHTPWGIVVDNFPDFHSGVAPP